MKEEKYNENEIRELLRRWYDGATSREEETRLSYLLIHSSALPPDLEADRKVFEALCALEKEEVEIPPLLEARISESIENEIGATKKESDSHHSELVALFRAKKFRMVVGGVAVCLAGIFITNRMMQIPEMKIEPPTSIAVSLPGKALQTDDSLSAPHLALVPQQPEIKEEQKSKIRKAATNMEKAHVAKTSTHRYSLQEQKREESEDNLYLSAEEEERLVRKNYHVVRDEEEADAILNSLFSRLESNVDMEASRISRVNLEYESEMMKLSELENYNSIKPTNYEYTPL